MVDQMTELVRRTVFPGPERLDTRGLGNQFVGHVEHSPHESIVFFWLTMYIIAWMFEHNDFTTGEFCLVHRNLLIVTEVLHVFAVLVLHDSTPSNWQILKLGCLLMIFVSSIYSAAAISDMYGCGKTFDSIYSVAMLQTPGINFEQKVCLFVVDLLRAVCFVPLGLYFSVKANGTSAPMRWLKVILAVYVLSDRAVLGIFHLADSAEWLTTYPWYFLRFGLNRVVELVLIYSPETLRNSHLH